MCDLKALFIEVRVIEHFHIKTVLKILFNIYDYLEFYLEICHK